MSAFEKIVEAIRGFGLPYEPEVYTGTEDHYFTYNYVTDRGGLFGDNDADTTVVSMQIHFFIPADENFTEIKNEIRRALVKHGFTFPEITILKEKEIRHIIFECDTEEEE